MANLWIKIIRNNNFLSLANNGLVAVLGFFSFILLVRILPTQEFGEWVLFLTTLNFLDMIRFGITRTAIVRFLSGSDEKYGKQLIGSNYAINLVSTLFLILLVYLFDYWGSQTIEDSGFSLFFTWFPVVALINLPFNNALSVLQARMRFDLILLIRIINVGSFMLFLIANYFFFHFGLQTIVWAYILTNLLSSLVSSLFNWDGILYLFHAKRKASSVILNFGKYTSGTLIGSNLLKSADTFIIGLSPFLGTTGVALYSIPLKLTEIIEIPIRSYAMTAFPGMSKASIEGNKELVMHIFYRNTGGMFLMMLPLMLFSFVFAKEFVIILGGPEYAYTAGIFQIFCLYGLLLPIDRFLGVALDSINKPKQNFFKVIYMTTANIVGDSVVVFGLTYIVLFASVITLVFTGIDGVTEIVNISRSFTIVSILEFVALVTILFTLIGIAVGFYYLQQEMTVKYRRILVEGINFYRSFFQKIFFAPRQ
ncbi:MAG: oligosaccharide flippase family protein [Bacteroidales bacterium]|nr:oligosaccharide flippase family protein [Bacteroidales bacterium]